MNLKRLLRTIYEAFKKEFNRPIGSEGYCPTSEEIQNDGVKRLANRLKAASYEETLTNILEWQERNIVFWIERHPLIDAFWIFLLTMFFGEIAIFALTILNIIPSTFYFSLIIGWVGLWGTATVTTVVIILLIFHYNRKFARKEIPKALMNVIMPNISMDFLLEKRLGICRDYARFTACLLTNIYPEAEIYFAHAPAHTATGIRIENRLYMLDQRLPILTIDRWNDYRNPRFYHKIERFEPSKCTLHKVDKKSFLQTKDKHQLDNENLINRITELLSIRKRLDEKAISPQKSIQILWKNGAIFYEEDEMTDYSLARWLAMKIRNELVETSQIEQITIETSHRKTDMIFRISYDPRR